VAATSLIPRKPGERMKTDVATRRSWRSCTGPAAHEALRDLVRHEWMQRVVYWQLAQLDVECEVTAPALVPGKAGDLVNTDHGMPRSCHDATDLTGVWVPVPSQPRSDSAAPRNEMPYK
jgi:hypothetical protein